MIVAELQEAGTSRIHEKGFREGNVVGIVGPHHQSLCSKPKPGTSYINNFLEGGGSYLVVAECKRPNVDAAAEVFDASYSYDGQGVRYKDVCD